MIFNTPEDIKKDVKNRISNYLGSTVGENSSIDTQNIVGLLRNYLNELKNIGEISNWDVDDETGKTNILVIIYKDKQMHYFEMDLFMELRKLKIVKIQEHNKTNLDNFLVIN